MKDQKLPAEHNVVRYVPFSKLDKDEDDNVRGILWTAFQPREADKNELSTAWLEYFPGSREEKISSAIYALRASMEVGAKSGFALGNVGEIISTCRERNHKIRIVHDPADNNKAHSSVKHMPDDDQRLLEVLAAETWAELILNSSIQPLKAKASAPDQPCQEALQALS